MRTWHKRIRKRSSNSQNRSHTHYPNDLLIRRPRTPVYEETLEFFQRSKKPGTNILLPEYFKLSQ